MSVTAKEAARIPVEETARLRRILNEGYGPGAWHGADLKAAVSDVSSSLAFWRPAPERHNVAEIALHHVYTTRNVRARLTGKPAPPFVLEGDDWFPLAGEADLSWSQIQTLLVEEQQGLAADLGDVSASGMAADERFNLVLGITCHAVYHAGQIQLLKRLRDG